ncbi:Macrolide export ATP-binding/permease protein MacB [bioreactor metagenome]|uniref:Macrolide export ATP-binding/permease protein MacB n=1 Tax=bioreactor metagenome TaxID=1076179 RepID=A0A644WBU0_9ZZZZ|nr:ABC transporter permease [Paludibacter sp.]
MDILQEIWSGLKRNKLRTILTGLSVSWGIFILIILMGAGNGLRNGVTSNFSDRSTNTVQLWPGRTSLPYKGYQSGRSLSFTEKELKKVELGVAEAINETPIVDKHLNISYKNEYGTYSVKGVLPHYENIFNLEFEADGGRFINETDIRGTRKVIVIDKKIQDVLFKGESPMGKFVKVDQVMFQVVGVNSKKERWGDGTAYIPYSTAQMVFNPNKKFYSMAMIVEGLETKEANEEFNDRLKENVSQTMLFDPKDAQALWINNSQQDYLQTMNIFNGISFFVLVIGIFTLIAGVVGVSNIMLVTVKERTREIGIRKAIGAPPAQILFTIILESILITALFGYMGMMAGIGITEVVNMVLEQSAAANPSGMSVFKNPTVNLNYVYFSTMIMIVAGIIAGYMPARKAVKIKPIEAMRDDN